MNKPTAEEIFNLRKKMGELYGPERADELWFGWLYKNEEIIRELKKEFIDCDEYPPLTKWFKEKNES